MSGVPGKVGLDGVCWAPSTPYHASCGTVRASNHDHLSDLGMGGALGDAGDPFARAGIVASLQIPAWRGGKEPQNKYVADNDDVTCLSKRAGEARLLHGADSSRGWRHAMPHAMLHMVHSIAAAV